MINKIPLHCNIDTQTKKELKIFAAKTNQNITKIVILAVTEWLKNNQKKT